MFHHLNKEIDIRDNMDEPGRHYAKRNKPAVEG